MRHLAAAWHPQGNPVPGWQHPWWRGPAARGQDMAWLRGNPPAIPGRTRWVVPALPSGTSGPDLAELRRAMYRPGTLIERRVHAFRSSATATGYGVETSGSNRSPALRSDLAGSTPPSDWLISAHSASRERPRASAITAMVAKAGAATRPDSILRSVPGETPASSAVLSIELSPLARRRRAPRRCPRSTSAGVSGNLTMTPILVPVS